MELRSALRTTSSIRSFEDRPVSADVIHAILDDARFAPSGGNRQAWRVIIVNDTSVRETIGSLYLDAWHDYIAQQLAGNVAFSPLATAADRDAAVAKAADANAFIQPDDFAANLATVPVLLVVAADLRALAATDRDLDRYHLVGGASIYPFVWNMMLSAHGHGLGGVITTVAIAHEPELRDVLHLPDEMVLAAIVALGYPTHRPTKLKRENVEGFTTVDTVDGTPFTVDGNRQYRREALEDF